MVYYSIWNDFIANDLDERPLVDGFLMNISTVNETTLYGTLSDMQVLVEFAKIQPRDHLLAYAGKFGAKKEITAADIPCFSTFENGAYRLNELLEFAPDGLTLHEIGYQLARSGKLDAQIKYGENHAKLASMMGVVSISCSKPFIVKNTAIGSFLVGQDKETKDCVIKLMLLQDPFVRHFLSCLQSTSPSYREIVGCLSDSTAYRRRTSVRCLMEYLLKGTALEKDLNSMDWRS